MKCVIEIEMDNEAFDDDVPKTHGRSGKELSAILQGLASDVHGDDKYYFRKWSPTINLKDSNGNTVGQAEFVDN